MNDLSKASAAEGQRSMNPSNDLSQRIIMGAWHPKDNTFAVAKHNSLFIYSEKRTVSSSNERKMNREREQKDREMAQ